MISCTEETFAAALPDIKDLVDEHWAEVGSFADKFRRDIDYLAYQKLEDDGRLLMVTMREVGVLLGYFIGATGLDLHRVSLTDPPHRVVMLSALVYYIAPHRRGYGRVLLRAYEHYARARGVQISNIRAKPGMNAADAFLSKMGYEVSEVNMTRLIGEAAHAGKRSAVD